MMKHTFSSLLPLKVLLITGACLLTISGSIVFGLIDEDILKYTGDKSIATKIVYTTGGFGFVTIVLAGSFYFRYKYRL